MKKIYSRCPVKKGGIRDCVNCTNVLHDTDISDILLQCGKGKITYHGDTGNGYVKMVNAASICPYFFNGRLRRLFLVIDGKFLVQLSKRRYGCLWESVTSLMHLLGNRS